MWVSVKAERGVIIGVWEKKKKTVRGHAQHIEQFQPKVRCTTLPSYHELVFSIWREIKLKESNLVMATRSSGRGS